MTARPIDRARLAPIVMAACDQDKARAEVIINDVVAEGTELELFDAALGTLIGFMRTTGASADDILQLAGDWLLKADMDAAGSSEG